jgi:hypothetical protein
MNDDILPTSNEPIVKMHAAGSMDDLKRNNEKVSKSYALMRAMTGN